MLNRKKAPRGMYVAREAIKAIGDISGVPMSATTFYQLVNDGVIERHVPKGKKEGLYSRKEVDLYARNWKALHIPYDEGTLDFGYALAEDLPYIYDLVASVSGGPNHAVPEKTLKAWIRKNPQSVLVLRRKNEVVGYVSGFTLPMDTLMLRLDGTLLNREIPIDDLLPFDPTPGAPFYIAEMAVKPSLKSIDDGNPTPDEHLGSILIKQMAHFILVDLKKQGFNVSELYGVGSSEFGINLCRKLGMQPLSLAKGVRDDRMPCKVSIEEAIQTPLFNRLIKHLIAA